MQPSEAMNETALVHRQQATAEDFMPLMTVDQAVARKSQINQFIAKVMHEGEDYGAIPGAGQKRVLLKPGAEKLCSIFGMAPTYERVTVTEDWTGAEHGGEPMFHYEYRCQLSRGGRFMGEAMGSANSWESKHRYRWVSEDAVRSYGYDPEKLAARGGVKTIFEPDFALEKRETSGQYGKPAEYWAAFDAAIEAKTARRASKSARTGRSMQGWEMEIDQKQYRIPNPETADIVNTLVKMAQKRALVAAVLVVTNCSDAFTQDLEDFGEMPDTGGHPIGTQAAADHVATEKINKAKAAVDANGAPMKFTTPGGEQIEVPGVLKPIFRIVDGDLSSVPGDFQKMKKYMADAGKSERYERLMMAFSDEHAQVTRDNLVHAKWCFYQMWLECEKVAVNA